MSTTDRVPARERAPESELEYRFDDDDSPSTVTVFSPEDERLATEWLTVDRTAAVPFEEMR